VRRDEPVLRPRHPLDACHRVGADDALGSMQIKVTARVGMVGL
jgi:hypothetical protein